MPERARDVYYFDTVTLSNFALVRRLDLLLVRYGRRAHLTQEVLDEISEGIVAGFTALMEVESAVQSRRFTAAGPFSPGERRRYRDLLRNLGPGEASCVVCAETRGGIVVTDDRAARERCSEKGIRFTGTIGILKACGREHVLAPSEADAMLDDMITAGYHAPVRRISDLL